MPSSRRFNRSRMATDGWDALINTVLVRRGLTESAVLPISLVLATPREDYVAGLSSYRHEAPGRSTVARLPGVGAMSMQVTRGTAAPMPRTTSRTPSGSR